MITIIQMVENRIENRIENRKFSEKMVAGISFFMVSSSDLKYKLMRHVTFNPLLFWIALGLTLTFYIFEHYQLWMMDSKA